MVRGMWNLYTQQYISGSRYHGAFDFQQPASRLRKFGALPSGPCAAAEIKPRVCVCVRACVRVRVRACWRLHYRCRNLGFNAAIGFSLRGACLKLGLRGNPCAYRELSAHPCALRPCHKSPCFLAFCRELRSRCRAHPWLNKRRPRRFGQSRQAAPRTPRKRVAFVGLKNPIITAQNNDAHCLPFASPLATP